MKKPRHGEAAQFLQSVSKPPDLGPLPYFSWISALLECPKVVSRPVSGSPAQAQPGLLAQDWGHGCQDSLMAPGEQSRKEPLGLGATGLGYQPMLFQPVPKAMLTWEGKHFMRARHSLGCWPMCAQVHSCVLLFLNQPAAWQGRGMWPGRRKSLAESQCWH